MAVAGRADRGADRPDPALDLTQGGAPARRSSCSFAQEAMMQIVQPRLPYSYSALEPYVSRSTLQLHYGKHHRAYVEKTKALAKQLRLADKPLEKIIALTAGQDRHRALFQNAAQAWNHARSEEHTSELQSLMRTSYAVFCLKKKKTST